MAVRLRPARKADAAQLAVLMDIASQGLVSHVWNSIALPGESPIEIGRARIAERKTLPSHFSNWTVAEVNDDVAAAYAGYKVPEPYHAGDTSELPAAYTPLLELEALAAGSWFLAVLAVFPEFRQRGLASRMLIAAELEAKRSRAKTISLTVSAENTIARELYLKSGFSELARRKRIALSADGDCADEWLLLTKKLQT
jgi:ribosomal protein S18 acetylase RimI-like enzyme